MRHDVRAVWDPWQAELFAKQKSFEDEVLQLWSADREKAKEKVEKLNPDIKTVVGGQHFTALAQESLEEYPEIDFIIRGEGEITLSEIIQALKDENYNIRDKAKNILERMGISTVGSLIQALKDEDNNVRSNAAEALGKIGDTRAVEPLTQTLKDKNKNVKLAKIN